MAGEENVVIKLTNYLAQQNAAAVAAGQPVPYLDELGLGASPLSPTIAQIVTEGAAVSSDGDFASGTVTFASWASGAGTFTLGGTTVSQTFSVDNDTSVGLLAALAQANAHIAAIATVTANAGVLTWTALQSGSAWNNVKFASTVASGTATLAPATGYATTGSDGSAASDASIVPAGDLLKVLGEALGQGTIVELFLTDAGEAPAPGEGTLMGTFTMSAQYPSTSSN